MRLVTASIVFALAAVTIAAPPQNLGQALVDKDLSKLQNELQVDLGKTLKKDLDKALSLPQTKRKLAVYRLIQVIGVKGLETVRKSPEGPKFLTWLVSKPDALEDYLASGSTSSYTDHGLSVWAQIWTKCPDSHEGIGLRLATASGLLFFRSWNDMTYQKELDPVKRLDYFMTTWKTGALFPGFDKQKTSDLCYVVSAWAPESELTWVRKNLGDNLKNQDTMGDICWMMPYRTENEKKASAWDWPKFYEGPMTMDALIKRGGICIQISMFGSSAIQAYGIPAIQVGQPSHNAVAWRNKEGSWKLANQIVDWPDTNQEYTPLQFGRRAVLLWAADAAQTDMNAFRESERLFWAATLMGDQKLETLTRAVERCPLNYPVVVEAATEASTKLKGEELLTYLLKVVKPLKDYPFPMLDIVQDRLTDLPTNLANSCKALDVVGELLQALADGDPNRQFGAAARARADLIAKVLRSITKTENDFSSPVWNGTDVDKTWANLDLPGKMNYMRGIEMLIKTGIKRKDLYEHPLNTYATYAGIDRSVAVRAIPVLSLIAKQAIADKVQPFAKDACTKLAEICDKRGEKETADKWRIWGSQP
jgi:hypothetical protein